MVVLINRYIDVENRLRLVKPSGPNYIHRVWNGLNEIFVRSRNYWICAYCHFHNFSKYDINEYLLQFHPSCNAIDCEVLRAYQPIVCANCYRHKSVVGRMTIVLQILSFGVFMIAAFPLLVIVFLFPALFGWLMDCLTAREENFEEDEENEKIEDIQTIDRLLSLKNMNPKHRSFVLQHKKYQQEFHAKQKQRKKKENDEKISRQLSQLRTQLTAQVQHTSSSSTLHRNLRLMIKNNSKIQLNDRDCITPYVNAIVDDIVSEKEPIVLLQQQMNQLSEQMAQLLEIVHASQNLAIANTMENIRRHSNQENGSNCSSSSENSNERILLNDQCSNSKKSMRRKFEEEKKDELQLREIQTLIKVMKKNRNKSALDSVTASVNYGKRPNVVCKISDIMGNARILEIEEEKEKQKLLDITD